MYKIISLVPLKAAEGKSTTTHPIYIRKIDPHTGKIRPLPKLYEEVEIECETNGVKFYGEVCKVEEAKRTIMVWIDLSLEGKLIFG